MRVVAAVAVAAEIVCQAEANHTFSYGQIRKLPINSFVQKGPLLYKRQFFVKILRLCDDFEFWDFGKCPGPILQNPAKNEVLKMPAQFPQKRVLKKHHRFRNFQISSSSHSHDFMI